MTAIARLGTHHSGRRYLWRGQADMNWSLEPSLVRFLRDRGLPHDEMAVRTAENALVKAARDWPAPEFAGLIVAQGLLAMLQHQGVKTGLLDFTTDPMTALWFACESETVTKTRQVRKTRWSYVSGQVSNAFDDLLVRASNSLPVKYFDALQPWDLKNLVGYQDEYLAGFVCESYQIDLREGSELAKKIMEGPIEETICSDIGGDHQRISSVAMQYYEITFKHLLLPLWLSAYAYGEKSYRFMVNARTGEVQGERPYSFWKIFFAVLAGLAVVGATLLAFNMSR